MTNLGPLTTTYTATGADCQSTYLAANNDNQWIQYGQTHTDECVPSSFSPFENHYYSPGICPSGYTYACEAGVGTSSTQATCCPVGYACRTGIDRDTDPFACASTFTSNTYLSVEYYKFTSETGGSTTAVNATSMATTVYLASASGFYVEAYGPIVRRSAGDPEWSSGTASATDSSSSTSTSRSGTGQSGAGAAATSTSGKSAQSGGGLSAGASAGIGVGVGLGCILFIGCIAAAYITGRRRRRSKQEAAAQGPAGAVYKSGIPVEDQVAELNSGWGSGRRQPDGYQAVEMDGRGHRSELDSNEPLFELPGQADSGHDGYYGHERA